MKKILLLISCFCFIYSFSFAQVDTLKGEDAKKLMRQIKMDTTKFLSATGDMACKCIDSISLTNKSSKEISNEIFKCIDKNVGSYQLALKLYHSMVDEGTNNTLTLNVDKESNEYQQYYFEIERWLTDSCPSIKRAAASDNKESEASTSSDKKARDLYNKGVKEMNDENYKDALPWFEKAVKQDEHFAFAWDNVGICRRKLGDLDGALEAYQKSLQLDPKGRLPLQNIPVVYEFQKKYDKALEAYQQLSAAYPDDPEAYYGSGRMYELKGDIEKALDYMCKAYNAYIAVNSPYRTDAENNISIYYRKMKDQGKEERFYAILKDNKINAK
ncbi:tetratricopeptide repeat protein [Ferruginibacter sp.]